MPPGQYLSACRINPTGEMYFDGTTLGPYDVLFVKLKKLMLEGHTPGTTNALRYGNWMSATVQCIWIAHNNNDLQVFQPVASTH